jgi:hypothetical protein
MAQRLPQKEREKTWRRKERVRKRVSEKYREIALKSERQRQKERARKRERKRERDRERRERERERERERVQDVNM